MELIKSTTSKQQYSLNVNIEQIVKQKGLDRSAYSDEELQYINQFSGYGGMAKFGAKGKGLLYEYFTPMEMIQKMVGLAYNWGYKKGGAVCEPSCGVGRFMHYFSPDTPVDGFEINPTSYAIASLNFPTFNFRNQYFNEMFVDRRGNDLPFEAKYDLIIGNPPYGAFDGKFTAKERLNTSATTYVDYFIIRGLDILKSGGVLVYVIPSAFLDGGNSAAKEIIENSALLVDSYRLPVNSFKETSIGTDIVVFKKSKPV